MVDKLLEISLGYGLEALFFTLFLSYSKKLKEKRITEYLDKIAFTMRLYCKI